MTLAQLQVGQRAVVDDLHGAAPPVASRLQALGIREGREITVVRRAAFGGPLQVRVGSADIVMRLREAGFVRLREREPAA